MRGRDRRTGSGLRNSGRLDSLVDQEFQEDGENVTSTEQALGPATPVAILAGVLLEHYLEGDDDKCVNNYTYTCDGGSCTHR
jgi:hypothetical protein